MSELKPFEVIMRIDFAASDKKQICAHAEKVQVLVRCKDCRKNPKIAWVGCPMAGKSQVFDEGYCHLGERREDEAD